MHFVSFGLRVWRICGGDYVVEGNLASREDYTVVFPVI